MGKNKLHPIESQPTETERHKEQELQPVFILHIEDDRADAFLIRKLLYGLRGYEHFYIDRVESIADAQIVLRSGRNYKIILLDLSVLDAMQLEGLKCLINMNLDIPIIVLTHTDDRELYTEARSMGAVNYLLKKNLTNSRAMLEHILLRQ